MKSTEYVSGLAAGLIIVLIIFLAIWRFGRRKMKGQFDERQELVRGRGYKYACFTLLGLITLYLLAESFGVFGAIPVTRELALFFIILTGVMVYALYCIKNDSYFGVGMDSRTYRAFMWIVIVCNAAGALGGLREGMTADGVLQFGPCASLLIVIAFVIVMAALKVRSRSAALEEAEEEADDRSLERSVL